MSSALAGLEATGAVTMSGILYVATVKADPNGRIRLVKSRSGEVRLIDRSQLSLQMFTSFLADFVGLREIEEITLVTSSSAGSHMANASAYHIESVLKMVVPRVHLVSSSAVTVYARRPNTRAPGADTGRLSREGARLQSRAITAALHRFRMIEESVDTEPCPDTLMPTAEVKAHDAGASREEERRRAVALKSKRARDRRTECRIERALELRAATALKEQLDFENRQF